MARGRKKSASPELYTEEQQKLIEKHISEHFGTISNFYQNMEDESTKLSINVIPASRKKPYVTLITSGMGAHVMKAKGKKGGEFENRAELVMYMPPYWKPDDNDDEAGFWPVRLLDLIANFASDEKTWLSWGHTIDYGKSFEEQSGFRGIILVMAAAGKDSWHCRLSDSEKVTFYQVVPLLESELRFAVKNGGAALAGRMDKDVKNAADPDRNPYVPDNFEDILDTAADHSCKIEEKELDLPEINGANHISSFLRWMIHHDMINDEFSEHFEEELAQIRAEKLDVRTFLMKSLDGELDRELFTDEGREFSGYYYDFYSDGDDPCYPSDVDSMALDYFGEERYNCDEFKDEAYLFVPYDEAYHEHMAEYIDRAYERFQSDK